MSLLLKRDRSNGVIYHHDVRLDTRTPMVLRGGHYHLFGGDGGVRFWTASAEDATNPVSFRVCFPTSEPRNPDGCTRTHSGPELREEHWGLNRATMLGELKGNGCNFVRVFLSDGVFLDATEITSIHPYTQTDAGKWRIAAATRGDQTAWNAEYFKRLRDFVAEADAAGVVVQVSLFSHHDLRSDLNVAGSHEYWSRSFWNPTQADDGANLVNISTDFLGTQERKKGELRNQQFMNVRLAGLMRIQRAFVVKVLETLCPLGNVILELMNEPRLLNDRPHALDDAGKYQAEWLDTVAGWILGWLAAQPVGWRPLISANATPPDHGAHDVDAWAMKPDPTCYPEVDAISYHGLTGYPDVRDAEAHCGTTDLPPVDRASIQKRVTEHQDKHERQSLIFSTDASRHFPQKYPVKIELQRRDGQVCTSLSSVPPVPPEPPVTPATERAQSDLDNWAYWVLRHGFDRFGNGSRKGAVHFQNHSSTEPSFEAVGAAAREVETSMPVSPRNMGRWGARFARTSGGSGNFWWAHRFDPVLGQIVNQLGMREAPEAAGAQGSSAIGWRYDITPAATSRFGFEADYEVVSVSDREQGARVTPRVAVTLFAVGAAGALGAQLGRTERVLAPGAGPGTLVLMADLAAGSRYAAVLSGEVAISYANRYQGYGETILRFPEMRLCGQP